MTFPPFTSTILPRPPDALQLCTWGFLGPLNAVVASKLAENKYIMLFLTYPRFLCVFVFRNFTTTFHPLFKVLRSLSTATSAGLYLWVPLGGLYGTVPPSLPHFQVLLRAPRNHVPVSIPSIAPSTLADVCPP